MDDSQKSEGLEKVAKKEKSRWIEARGGGLPLWASVVSSANHGHVSHVRVQGDTNKTKIVFNSSTFSPQQVVHASHPLLDTFAMRALSRIIIAGLILATLLWLRGQFSKLHQSILALDRLSQDGGLLSNHVHSNNTNASSTAVEDPFRAVMHAISNTLLNGTIENLATPKSGLRDTRTKVVVVAKTAKEHTQWVARMLPKYVNMSSNSDQR